MQFYEVDETDGEFAVSTSLAGRLAEAGTQFLVWAPLAMLGLSVLFMPDYVCQYREQQPVPGMFWGVMAFGAFVIAAIAAVVRFARRDTWIFDVDAGRIAFRADPMIGTTAEAEVALEDWTDVELRAVGFPRVSGVAVEFEGRPNELVCTSRFGWETVSEVAERLRAFIDEHDLPVQVRKRTS